MKTQDVRDYLNRAIGSFVDDPPDNAWQHGFLAALEMVHSDLFLTQQQRAEEFKRQNASRN